ncbi:MFS transporter [Alicyclobacillus dauci]|uniref:MFS transporter n=1 Tax=Alicyclobacillus dauci TaxID=1475485 RepID=A0ABY6ZA06_9BACL|nr:MFS transporter [Alicyclobacillus dauci]WAH38930.1 MFS transporter [Alicyclobacillus dauci]
MMTRRSYHFGNYFPLPAIARQHGYHWFVVGTVCIGAFMAALDASIVSVALPTLQSEFHTSMAHIEWVSLVYLLTLAALIVPFGRLSDMVGRRWMYTLGFTVFLVGSYLCATSQTLIELLVFRAIQGTGAALLQANSVSLITAATPYADRGKAIGIQAFAQGLGLCLGPFLGGLLVHVASWTSIFYINVPIGIMGTIIGICLLPRQAKVLKQTHFDFLGAIFLAITLVATMYVLKEGLQPGVSTLWMCVLIGVIVLFSVLFWTTEQRQEMPLIDLSYIRQRSIWLGNLTGLLSFSVMYAVTLLGPFWLIHGRGMTSLSAGLYLCVIPAGMALFTPLSGFLADHIPNHVLTRSGMALAGTGCLLLAIAPSFIPLFLIGAFLVGCGLGTFTPPNNSRVMSMTPPEHLGVAGSILNMSRTIGMGFGVTVGGVSQDIFLRLFGKADLLPAFRGSFLVSALLAIATLLLLLVNRNTPSTQE